MVSIERVAPLLAAAHALLVLVHEVVQGQHIAGGVSPLRARVPHVRVKVVAVLKAVRAVGAAVGGLLAALDALVAPEGVPPPVRLAAVRTGQASSPLRRRWPRQPR